MAETTRFSRLTPAQLGELSRFSTCVTASAIEQFRVRLYNAGFADSRIRCQFQDLPPVLGYAATARIRSAEPPMVGDGYSYYNRSDWWNNILMIPPPRIVVIEDMDEPCGQGAFVGAVHSHILNALGCVALVTNGAVRDVPEVRSTGLQVFASNVAVSHAYAHIFEFGGKVHVGGLVVAPGDLVQGDLHGVQTIPLEVAAELPNAARTILERRKRLMDLCRSRDFSLEKLQQLVNRKEESNV